MKTESMHIGMQVRHPQYGVGTVKALNERSAEIAFDEGIKTVDPALAELAPAEPTATVSALEMPLRTLIEETVHAVVEAMGLEPPDTEVTQLGTRWHHGRLVLQPADPTLQTKEVPLETFFHKIVLVRNNLRVLEQKINAHPKLEDAEKVELQQYITRCYGSLTTFNVLFRHKEDQFGKS